MPPAWLPIIIGHSACCHLGQSDWSDWGALVTRYGLRDLPAQCPLFRRHGLVAHALSLHAGGGLTHLTSLLSWVLLSVLHFLAHDFFLNLLRISIGCVTGVSWKHRTAVQINQNAILLHNIMKNADIWSHLLVILLNRGCLKRQPPYLVMVKRICTEFVFKTLYDVPPIGFHVLVLSACLIAYFSRVLMGTKCILYTCRLWFRCALNNQIRSKWNKPEYAIRHNWVCSKSATLQCAL